RATAIVLGDERAGGLVGRDPARPAVRAVLRPRRREGTGGPARCGTVGVGGHASSASQSRGPSPMNELLQAILSGVGAVGETLDAPGAYLRGALSGRLGERASGREMLESWGAL